MAGGKPAGAKRGERAATKAPSQRQSGPLMTSSTAADTFAKPLPYASSSRPLSLTGFRSSMVVTSTSNPARPSSSVKKMEGAKIIHINYAMCTSFTVYISKDKTRVVIVPYVKRGTPGVHSLDIRNVLNIRISKSKRYLLSGYSVTGLLVETKTTVYLLSVNILVSFNRQKGLLPIEKIVSFYDENNGTSYGPAHVALSKTHAFVYDRNEECLIRIDRRELTLPKKLPVSKTSRQKTRRPVKIHKILEKKNTSNRISRRYASIKSIPIKTLFDYLVCLSQDFSFSISRSSSSGSTALSRSSFGGLSGKKGAFQLLNEFFFGDD